MIFLGMATHGDIKSRTMLSVIGLKEITPIQLQVAVNVGCYIPVNRYRLARYAVDSGASHLFFVDSDMTFPPNTLIRLLMTEKDIVGTSYFMRRQSERMTTVRVLNAAGELEILFEPPKELTKVAAVGTGCMLISTAALKNIPQPWFNLTFEPSGELNQGEDIWFCEQARKAGYDIWCEPSLNVGHVGDYVYQ